MFKRDIIHGNRRADRRYDLELELRFSYELHGVTHMGAGHTIDLSGGGIRFRSDTPPPNGVRLSLRIAWPHLLQNVCPLELLASGVVPGTDSRGTVMRMTGFEFKTYGERSFNQGVVAMEQARGVCA